MVDTEGHSIHGGLIGIITDEQREVRICGIHCSIWHRKAIQKSSGGNRRRRVGPGRDGWHVRCAGLRLTESQTFVGEEKKRSIMTNGAAKNASKVILALGRAWERAAVGYPIVRIQKIVAKVVE